jgi:hypothetical protein
MGMTGQRATTRTGRLVNKLKADREDEGKDKLNKRLAIAEQLKVGGFILKINGNGAVLSARLIGVAHVSFLSHQAS